MTESTKHEKVKCERGPHEFERLKAEPWRKVCPACWRKQQFHEDDVYTRFDPGAFSQAFEANTFQDTIAEMLRQQHAETIRKAGESFKSQWKNAGHSGFSWQDADPFKPAPQPKQKGGLTQTEQELIEQLPRLLSLCFPDKHDGSERSNDVTRWLLSVRKRLTGKD